MDIPLKNQFFGIFFYLLYLLAMVKPVMPIVEYYANYDYIAAVLCENKDKPYLNCNGKCYLKSQIEKNDYNNSHDHNSTIPSISLKDYPLSPIDEFSYNIKTDESLVQAIFSEEKIISKGIITSLFKPPRV